MTEREYMGVPISTLEAHQTLMTLIDEAECASCASMSILDAVESGELTFPESA